MIIIEISSPHVKNKPLYCGVSPPSAPLRSRRLFCLPYLLLLWVPPPGYPRPRLTDLGGLPRKDTSYPPKG